MDLEIQAAEQEQGRQQTGNDGRTRYVKTLPATNPRFQSVLEKTSHTASWSTSCIVRHTNSLQDQQKLIVSAARTNTEYFSGTLLSYQLNTHRPSYINAVLVQTRGQVNPVRCSSSISALYVVRFLMIEIDHCASHPYHGPFLDCVSLPHERAGACANCKFKDWAARCSLNDGSGPDRYRTTPAGPAAGSLAPAEPPIQPYEIEEPESDGEKEDVPIVRQITDGR